MATLPVQMDRLQGPNIDLSRLQDNIDKAIQQVSTAANNAADTANAVTSDGIAAGQLSVVQFTAIQQSVTIPNPLGQKIQGLIPVNLGYPAFLLLDPNQGALNPAKQLKVILYPLPGVTIPTPLSANVWFF